MNVLYLSRAIFPSGATHTLSIMRMCQALADSGHRVALSGREGTGASSPDLFESYGVRGTFDVHLFKIVRWLDNRFGRRLFLPSLALALRSHRLFRTFKPDLIYSRLTLLELLAVPKHLPLVFEMHNLGHAGQPTLEGRLFRWIMGRKNVVRVVVTTNALKHHLQPIFPDQDIQVARLSAEHPQAIADDELTRFRDANLRGKQFTQHVGYTGYLDDFGLRGTDIICQTASLTPHAAFHIVGGEPDKVAHWRDYAKDYNQHRNIFFYGHRNPSQMPHFLSCFDVVLEPLQLRTAPHAPDGLNMSPLKIPQYMSFAKPIVASDLIAHRELLEHDRTALLVEASNPRAWSEAISRLLADNKLGARLAEAARAAYLAEFTPEQRIQRILNGVPGLNRGLAPGA